MFDQPHQGLLVLGGYVPAAGGTMGQIIDGGLRVWPIARALPRFWAPPGHLGRAGGGQHRQAS
jgi:hypothetical protein